MELFVIRHGKTDWNKEGRFQGSKNIDLNEEGKAAAVKLGKHLEEIDFDYIFSSPLNRAYETACLIRGKKSIPITKNNLITEISFGILEGLPFDEWMNTDHPRKYFFDNPGKYIPPEGGETFESGCKRSKEFVQTAIEPIFKLKPNAKILVVAHGAILAALMCYLENRTVENFWGNGLKGNCEETIYTFDGKSWSVTLQTKAQENPYVKIYKDKKMSGLIIKKSDENSADKTAQILKKGGIAILPTDTVYGFSGIVDLAGQSDYKTDEKIRATKGRSETKPLIELIAKPEDINLYTNDKIPSSLLEKWPGALTIIVHTKEDCPLCPKLPTIAFRCPGDPWLRKVIENCGAPIFSTSVNRSGKPVLDTVEAIKTEFSNEADLIIDDGDKKGALPSTLVSIEKNEVKVLRQGSVII